MAKTVVVTGPIGSGKSEVCRYLASKGVPVYDCDSAVKALYQSEDGLMDEIETAFGQSFRPGGKFDKSLLAEAVFKDKNAIEFVESIVFPYLKRDIVRWKERFEEKDFVVIESATLTSKPFFDDFYDKVVLVKAPESKRSALLEARGTCPDRVSFQSFDDSAADWVILNDSTLEDLYKKTGELLVNI